MNFSKVKNFIIILLVVINIALGGICIVINYQKSYISQQETTLAKEHLENFGINAEFQKDSKKRYNLPIYSFEKESEEELPEIYIKTAEKFFDCNISKNEFVTIPGGYSLSVINSANEVVGTVNLNVQEMLFECQREVGITNADKQIIKKSYYESDLEPITNKQIRSKAEKFVASLKDDYEILYESVAISEYNEGYIVYFSGVLSSTNISDFYINIYVKNGKIQYLVGNIPSKAPKKSYSSPLIDYINAIYLLTENKNVLSITENDKKIFVENEEIVYKLYEYETDKFYLIPTWYIEYSDDEKNEYSIMYDAIIGKIVTEN